MATQPLSPPAQEALMQLFVQGPTWDGNLINKTGRNELCESGLADYADGWNFLTEAGVRTAVILGVSLARSWHDQSWYRKASLR